jgi:hypothetical protein
MAFDPLTFPVANTPQNLITFAPGNQVNVPESAGTCPVRTGKVKAAVPRKWTIMVTLEEPDE